MKRLHVKFRSFFFPLLLNKFEISGQIFMKVSLKFHGNSSGENSVDIHADGRTVGEME